MSCNCTPKHSYCHVGYEIIMQHYETKFSRQMHNWNYISEVPTGCKGFKNTCLVKSVEEVAVIVDISSDDFFINYEPQPCLFDT